MRRHNIHIHLQKWILVVSACLLSSYKCENQQWSKPEQSASVTPDNSGWIPVQGKCLTCRPNRDLDTQSSGSHDQIGKVLSPPVQGTSNLGPPPPPPPPPQLQFAPNKQPRILPFGPNFHQFNVPFLHDNKQYQLPPTKLFPQEGQKQFYQFQGNHFVKQPYNLPQQQLIQAQNQQFPQQRYPVGEPYPFTLPGKPVEVTTPKIAYQQKIRFPENEPNKPLTKVPGQNADEIQLLYVPVETLQRQRNVKNMKEIVNQNQQFQYQIPHGFVNPPQHGFVNQPQHGFVNPPQFNLQYPPVPKLENQFYFPPNFAPAHNFFQLNPVPPQKIQEPVFSNISKNFLHPYFTINGLYSPIPQLQIPTKQPDYQVYNILQPGVLNQPVPHQGFANPTPIPVKNDFSTPLPEHNRQPNKYDYPHGNQVQNVEYTAPSTIATPDSKFYSTSSTYEPYTATTPNTLKSTDYNLEQSTLRNAETGRYEFNYQQIAGNPQSSASQSQQYFTQQYTEPQKNFTKTYSHPSSLPPSSPSTYDDNYPVPHQPPLSFYMEKLHNTKVNDVLYLLKEAKTIPVLDTVEAEPPQVFVGPSELQPPKGYIKFELPYLSSLDYNRIERMIDRLPFFVAPLNFKPPPGYSKIPFPAPHIGSVVLSNSSVLQESLSKYDQKYKPNVQTFSAPAELSTITPQLTSEINSLLESPPPSVAADFKTYEQQTKKTSYKNNYRPVSSTEAPKRLANRQRKPIYRGYPSTESSVAYETTPITESQKIDYSKDDYVEFSAKGKFNLGGNSVQQTSVTYQPQQIVDNTYQTQQVSDNIYQAQSDKTYEPQVSSTYEPVVDKIQFESNHTNYQTAVPELPSQQPQLSSDYFANQNYPFFNYDSFSSQSPNSINDTTVQNTTQESQNYNFNNVKPLSQYNHFEKDASSVNISEVSPTSAATQDGNSHFWNQNEFYKSRPETVEYFSSTQSTQVRDTTAYPTEQNIVQSRFSKYSTESPNKYVETTIPEFHKLDAHNVDPTTTHRTRGKQRLPGRYQSKYTTEKHETENDLAPKSTSESNDFVQSSTEGSELITKTEIKRRRRPVKPAIVTPVTEVSSSTSRSYRTRATRYPASSTERYRTRRPTTNSATTESEWNYVNNNLAPSAPAANEIANEKKTDLEKGQKPESDSYWSEAVSVHQSQSYEVNPSAKSSTKNLTEESHTESLAWNDVSKVSPTDSYYPTAESNVPERTESAVESKVEKNQKTISHNEKSNVDESGPSAYEISNTNEDQTEKNFSSDTKKDGQKKAYDPQEEKKTPGRRRGTWVRRIRVKRPQDVFETAESQNLGRITDNSVQLLDSKILSKTEEKSESDFKTRPSTVLASSSSFDDYITTSTEVIPDSSVKTTSEKEDDYENLQSNFAQMLSDFLNSNKKYSQNVNIERNNITTESSISYILGLENKGNDSSSSFTIRNGAGSNSTETVEDVITTTGSYSNIELSDVQSTTDQVLQTNPPNEVVGTSTTTEISLETEICYRGKCVKTKKSKASDLLPVE